MDRVGQQLGNYRLIRSLGSGGFADVYLGEHIYLKTLAAIKILQTRLAQNDLQVFLAEARTIANLTNRNIVQVLEFGVEKDTPFLVMTYAPNGTLRQRHPSGSRLSTSEVVSYIKQVTDALQYAHERKIIHRDVKPENMLIGQNSDILLSDFGIAVVAQSSRYSGQEVGGTAAYMAPEQLQGRAIPASDQYALAVTAYEWLTGERPFKGSFAEIYGQHLSTPPPSLRQKVPSLPPPVEQVILIALNKDPQQRFPSIQAFANALAQASGINQGLNPPVTYNNATRPEEQISTIVKPPSGPTYPPLGSDPSLTYPASNNPSQQGINPSLTYPARNPLQQGSNPSLTYPASNNPSQQGINPSLTYPARSLSQQANTSPPPPPPGFSMGEQSGNVNPPPFTHSGMASGQFPPQGPPIPYGQGKKRGSNMLAIIALVVILVLVIGGGGLYFLASKKPSSTTGVPPIQSTATSAQTATSTPPTSVPTGSTSVPTGSTTATPPISSSYSATQPGPGCDTNGGTWTPQGISKITCGTQLSVNSSNSRGYLYFQLPNNEAFSSNNSIGITGNVGEGGPDCVGLAEQDANRGFLAEYCGGGQWSIYSISSSGGAIIQTLDKGLTSTRTSEQLLLTLKGTTLSFSIDTEVHTINVSPIQPTKVAITLITSYYGVTTTVTNFSYTVLSS